MIVLIYMVLYLLVKMSYKYCSAIALAALLSLTSCVKESVFLPENSQNEIVFNFTAGEQEALMKSVSVPNVDIIELSSEKSSPRPLYLHMSSSSLGEEKVLTRAGEGGDISGHASFGVYGFVRRETDESGAVTYLMRNVEVSKESTGTLWAPTGEAYYWPGYKSRLVSFLGYAPYGATGLSTVNVSGGVLSYGYITPSTPDLMVDLLLASSDELPGDGSVNPVPLTFSHALTGIRFVIGDDMVDCSIASIALNNHYSTATLDLGSGQRQWTGHGSVRNTVQSGLDLAVTADMRGNQIGKTLYVLPQTLPANASVSMVISIGGSNVTLTASLADRTLNAGDMITFTLSSSSISVTPVIYLNKEGYEFTYTGGTDKFNIQSYENYKGVGNININKPVDYTIEYYGYNEDTGEYDVRLDGKPDWLTGFDADGLGSTTNKTVNYTVAAQEGVTVNPHTDALRAAAEKGTQADPHDLSMYTIEGRRRASGMTTANCYIVSSPGWYCFPLVYGNAVEKGVTNTIAYDWPNGHLKRALNHRREEITSPFLSENKGVVSQRAQVLWNDAAIESYVVVQDAPITKSVEVDGQAKDVEYVVFNVPRETIMEGNAVIAIRNPNDTIMWSWNIWISDEKFNEYIDIGDGVRIYDEQFVGYTNSYSVDYARRGVKVVFVQEGGYQKSFTVSQKEYSDLQNESVTLYQWGRKDSFPGVINYPNGSDYSPKYKNVYAIEGINPNNRVVSQSDYYNGFKLEDGIKSPAEHRLVGDVCRNYWCGDAYPAGYNGHGLSTQARNHSLNTCKTVYDPTPPGCAMVPYQKFANACGGYFVNAIKEIEGEKYFSINGKELKCRTKWFYIFCRQTTNVWTARNNSMVWTPYYTWSKSGYYNYSWNAFCVAYASYLTSNFLYESTDITDLLGIFFVGNE